MLSKTLSFNRGVLKQATRSVGWISIAYFLCLLFVLPLQLLMAHSRDDEYIHKFYFTELDSLFGVVLEIQMFASFIAPVLLAVFLFRYLQVKLPADYMHSLPIRREALFNQYITLGSLLLFIPVLITGLILLGLRGYLEADVLLSVSSIASWVGITTLINLFVFFAGVFIAMFTGISILQAVLTYILFVFPAGITVLILTNIDFFLYGFSVNYHLSQDIENLIPFIRVASLSNEPFTGLEIISCLLLIVAFYVTSLLVYRKRHIESATQAVSFRHLRPVFLYGVTFCAMLVGGAYFGSTQEESLGWIIFGYVTASLLGYVIAQMILEKTWRVFDKWKGYLVFIVCISIVGIFINTDIIGYEQKIPNSDTVEQASLAYNVHQLTNEYVYYDDLGNIIGTPILDDTGEPFGRELYTYATPDNIANIIQLHQQLVNDQAAIENTTRYYQNIVIAYDLKDGSELVREYRIPQYSYRELFAPIMDSDEYKYNYFPLLRINDLSKLNTITFRANHIDKQLIISDPDKLAELHAILQTEMENTTSEQLLNNYREDTWASIEYNWQITSKQTRQIHYEWKKSYQLVEDWLIDNDLLEKARHTANDIARIVIMENEDWVDTTDSTTTDTTTTDTKETVTVVVDKDYPAQYRAPYSTKAINHPDPDKLDQLENALIIEDKSQIEQVIRAKNWDENAKYHVFVYFHNSRQSLLMLTEETAPAFVNERF